MEALVRPLLEAALGDTGLRSDGSRVPLSTPDLHFLVDSLQLRAEEIKDRVHSTVQSGYDEIVGLVTDASETAFDNEALFRQCQAVLDQVTDLSSCSSGELAFDSKIWNLATEMQTIRSELSRKQAELNIVNRTITLRDDLLLAKGLFDKGHIVEGVSKLADMRKSVFSEAISEKGLILQQRLEKLCQDIADEMEAALKKTFFEAVFVDDADGKLVVTLVVGRLELVATMESMDILGVLDSCFSLLMDAAQKPLTLLVTDPSRVIEVHRGAEKAVLAWPRAGEREAALHPLEVYDRVLQLVRFLHEHVANYRQGWMRKMGRLVWPRLADLIIENSLRKAVPNDPAHFGEFEKLQEQTLIFEVTLRSENFIASEGTLDRLTRFTSEMEAHFAATKCNRVLAKARHLLAQFDYNIFLKQARTTEKTELLFKSGECKVSHLPKQLLSIVDGVLKDAILCTPRIALELYGAARDILLLFRAVLLLKSGSSKFQAALICHNDCLYMAHQLLSIPYRFNSSSPTLQQRTRSFVDLVPLFQHMADQLLTQQLNAMTHSLKQVLDNAKGFYRTDEYRNYEAANQALKEVVASVASAEKAARDVVSKAIEAEIFKNLIDYAMRRILYEVMSLDDMSVEETSQLHSMLEEVTNDLLSVVEPYAVTPDAVPSWKKLKSLTGLLEMSLKPITKAWESGELRDAGFASSEVRSLVRSIFADTELRAECLARIVDI